MRQLITRDQAVPTCKQHTTPCSDCPWTRKALKGWLGGATPEEWVRVAHSDTVVDCHTMLGPQCAGIAIYRRNVAKWPLAPNLRLEKDREAVFATPMEFP